MIYGCDLSNYQYTVDFDLLKTRIAFVSVKSTEGIGFVDPTFSRNWAEAKRVGLVRGAYHFARPDLGNGASAEANYFCNIVGDLSAGDLVALDFEVAWGGDHAPWSKNFLDTVRDRTGVSPFIYLNLSEVNSNDWSSVINAGYPLWLADYDFSTNQVPTPWPVLAMKQYSDAGNLPGIPVRNVDLNVFYGDLTALAKYGKVDDMAITQAEFNAMAAVWWSQVAAGPATINDMKGVETKTVETLRKVRTALGDLG